MDICKVLAMAKIDFHQFLSVTATMYWLLYGEMVMRFWQYAMYTAKTALPDSLMLPKPHYLTVLYFIIQQPRQSTYKDKSLVEIWF